jgi:transposase
MLKIPRQEYTAEFKELAVKRVRGGQGIAAVARELGLVEQTLRYWVSTAKGGQAQSGGNQGDPSGADGTLAGAGQECAAPDGA